MTNKQTEESIDINQVFITLKKNVDLIIKVASLSILMSVLIYFFTPDYYKSQAVLKTYEQSNSNPLSNLQSQYSSLASFAGASLPFASGANEADYCKELLLSKDFFAKIIDKKMIKDLLGDEAAIEYYTNSTSLPKKNKLFELAHIKFLKVFNVELNNKNNFFKLSYRSSNPKNSKLVLENIITKVNNIIKEKHVSEAYHSISYLETQLKANELINTDFVLGALLSEAYETIAVSESRAEYFLQIIDSPRESYKPTKLSFIMHILISSLLGSFLGIFYILLFKPFGD